ncbi:AimR family lysis-lysogeny pheromone receptor [Bacillus cereus]|uniref:AimR family lysis-lysogeny pheromone receptor n=1 Tax=Bacillus cereus TaxID=1396 RepID=UPI0027EFE4A6|nr:hypothetical protein [Bacillus cereus]
MIKLIERVEAERERRGISFGKIESITGISSSVICDGLSGKTKEMRLENFISIVNVIYDKILERSTYINRFISLMENDKNKIKALFFLQAQGEYELLDKLILTYSTSKAMKSYLSIFEFYNLRNMGIKNGQELEIELDKSRFSTLPECQVLVNLLYGFCMYDIPNVQSMMTYSERAGRYLEKVENSFVKDCLKMMYKERLAFIKLLSDEVEESRAVCWDIINSETPYKIIQASAYGCLGEGFQFECVSTAEKYLLKGLDIIAANGIDRYSRKYKAFHTTLAHIYLDNSFNLEKINHQYLDVGEEAHLQLKFGDAQIGEKMYLEMEKTGKLSPHRRFSRAKVKGDMKELKRVLVEFERIGNIFYANGVKNILITEEV